MGISLRHRPVRACSVFILCLTVAVCAACASGVSGRRAAVSGRAPAGVAASLPRAEPPYLQWLERQSMLRYASQAVADISGTRMLWRNSAATRRADMLLEAAPNWLEVNPYLCASSRPLFVKLAGADFLGFLSGMGISGLYVTPVGERADVWKEHASAPAADPDGDDIAALRFEPALGNDVDFENMAENLENAQIQLGGDLPSAATGLGPDFILQARQVTRFGGIYAMVPLPRKYWDMLPPSVAEWDCRPLAPDIAKRLAEDGLIPPRLTRDILPWASRGGWAVTGEVTGIDGETRRLLYRYHEHALRPVLLWPDPSGNARRIFSAAVIQHTGLRRQALAGVRMEPLMGLDVVDERAERAGGPRGEAWSDFTPGPEAINDVAREAHRYGGWLMQADVLPQSLTRHVLGESVDFARDSATWPAVAYALLSADAAPLAALLRRGIEAGVEQGRLVRGLHDGVSIDWRAFLALPDGLNLARKAQNLAGGPPDSLQVRLTSAALATRALSPGAERPSRQADGQSLRQACLSLLSWRVGLPGLVFVSPQDLTGAPLSGASGDGATTPLWDLEPRSGQASGSLVFGPLPGQWASGESFAHSIGRILSARRETGLYKGTLQAVVSGPGGCVAAVSKLPDGRHWLLATNFSGEQRTFSIKLPQGVRGQSARDMISGAVLAIQDNRSELVLEARSSRHLLIF